MSWDKKFWREIQRRAPVLCVDAVVVNDKGEVLLSKRAIEPEKGKWHTPGGVVKFKERVEEAVIRVVEKEAGIVVDIVSLLGVYSDPKRDPRGHFVTIGYLMKPIRGKLKGDFQSSELQYFKKLPEKMGFATREIAEDGLKVYNALFPLRQT